MSKYDDLVKKLKEIFQIDRPELNFGVYRNLDARVGEINDYLENRLKAKVGESLATRRISRCTHKSSTPGRYKPNLPKNRSPVTAILAAPRASFLYCYISMS